MAKSRKIADKKPHGDWHPARRALALLAAPLVILMVLGAGWLFQTSGQNADPTSSAGGTNVGLVADHPRAPDFSIATTDGTLFRLADYRGQVVVLFFTGPG